MKHLQREIICIGNKTSLNRLQGFKAEKVHSSTTVELKDKSITKRSPNNPKIQEHQNEN